LPQVPRSYGEWLPGSFLAQVGSDAAHELLGLARPRLVAPGEHITRQGERSVEVYVLQARTAGAAACVKVTSVARNGTEIMLAIRTAGDLIGEGAALRDRSRMATVTACAHAVAHAVERQRFLSYLNRNPAAWRALSTMLVDRLEWADRRRLDFSGYDVKGRLIRVMLELAERHGKRADQGVDLGVNISQMELGNLVGAKLDAVSQAMRVLRTKGLVSYRYRCVRIHDLAAMRREAGED
jgi:CRP/FNR family transcriptional regulator, cyclic AMP receptor protein